jgi:hypothetical protein
MQTLITISLSLPPTLKLPMTPVQWFISPHDSHVNAVVEPTITLEVVVELPHPAGPVGGSLPLDLSFNIRVPPNLKLLHTCIERSGAAEPNCISGAGEAAVPKSGRAPKSSNSRGQCGRSTKSGNIWARAGSTLNPLTPQDMPLPKPPASALLQL